MAEVPNYYYVLQPRQRLVGDEPPHAYDLIVFSDWDQEVKHALWARIDWQDGLTIWQTENIEPTHWMAVARQIDLAMREARKLIGSTWIHGEFEDDAG